MKWAVIILIILGIIAAISASLLISALRTEKDTTLSGSGMVKAVVAKKPLSAMSGITSQDIEVMEVQKKGLAVDHFSDITQVIGKVLAVRIVKGQVITKSNLISEGSGAQLVAALPPGMRAVSIPVSKHSVMGGLLYPGCLVDVIATFRLRSNEAKGEALSTTLLRGVQVLAIQEESIVSKTDQEQQTRVRHTESTLTVTLKVDSRQAEALQLATNNGKVTLAMRNPLDKEEVESDAMVLSQGRLAKLGQLLGPSVSVASVEKVQFDESGELILVDPNSANQSAERISAGRLSSYGSSERLFGGTKRLPQWQITVIRGKEVKEEVFEMTAPDTDSQK